MEQDKQAKKKLLIATGIFPPDIGGPATYVSALLEELPKHGFDVEAITYTNNKSEPSIRNWKLEIGNYQIHKVSRRNNIIIRYFQYFYKTYKLLAKMDLVYIQGPVSEGIPAWLACKLRGKKYILKVVGDYAWESYQSKISNFQFPIFKKEFINPETFQDRKFDFKTELLRRLERKVAKDAFKIITPSNYLKKIVMKWGIADEKIKVIYNASPRIEKTTSKEEARLELELTGRIILTVGRMVSWKGFDALVDLMPELLKIFSDLKLVIIGDGTGFQDLRFKIENLRLKDSVILTGSMPKEQVMKYMAAADGFVLNTGYEGLSHVIIEAMKSGLPVITTDVGGNPELIINGRNGILVPYGRNQELLKAIITLITNNFTIDDAENINNEKLKALTKEQMIDSLIKELD